VRPLKPDPYDPSARFATTCWTVVAQAGDPDAPAAREALAELCQAYWYPLYAFVRRRGSSPEQAEDLTQGFFADLLARGSIATADRARGRFRSFLLTALENYIANDRDAARRAKRGGGVRHVSIDFRDAEGRYLQEPAHEITPERLFDRRWATTLLDLVLDRLRRELAAEGKDALFARLKPSLMSAPRDEDPAYAEIGAALGMTDGAVRVAAHRLRKRYRALLLEAINRTVADPDQVDAEICELFLAFKK
jgi:RNA polymerase sigma-70 factor (ECF subfamily)